MHVSISGCLGLEKKRGFDEGFVWTLRALWIQSRPGSRDLWPNSCWYTRQRSYKKLQLTKDLVPILHQSLRQSGSLKRWLFWSAYKAVKAIQEGTHRRSNYNSQHGKKKEGNGDQCGKCCEVQHSKAQTEHSYAVYAIRLGTVWEQESSEWSYRSNRLAAVIITLRKVKMGHRRNGLSSCWWAPHQWSQDQHSVISESTYCSLISQSPLEPVNIPLDSSGGVQQCLGQIPNTVSYKGKTHSLHLSSGGAVWTTAQQLAVI